MEELSLLIDNKNELIIQNQSYIEDGWYVRITSSKIELWEIPLNGGKDYLINGDCESVISAIRQGQSLT